MTSKYLMEKSETRYRITFTQRESQCLAQAAKGKNLSQIAKVLNITKTTVSFYFANVRRKIDLLLVR